MTVTAARARHGPVGCEPFSGEVIGFVLTAPDLPTIYVSGDNAALELVEQVAERFGPVDTAILFAGAARVPFFDDLVTMNGVQVAEAAKILNARRVVSAHDDSWAHFSENRHAVVDAFAAAGVADRLQGS